MKKEPFVTKEQLDEIVKEYPTPFHLYDEKGIRANAKALKEAFSWNPGFKEYFAVKATPNPFLINILKEYGCGCDCSSMTELMLADALHFEGQDIMFSSNATPADEFRFASDIGAVINLDDFTHIDFLEKTISGVSTCNTPLSMMLIGMMLAEMDPRGMLDGTMAFYTSVRLLLVPAVIFGITLLLPISPLLRGITVIIAGMPAPVTTALLSAKYDGDEKYATAMIFVTTILSLVTLPAWCYLLGV